MRFFGPCRSGPARPARARIRSGSAVFNDIVSHYMPCFDTAGRRGQAGTARSGSNLSGGGTTMPGARSRPLGETG